MKYGNISYLLRKIGWIFTISLYAVGCTRSMPVQHSTPVFPATSTIPAALSPTAVITSASSPMDLEVATETPNRIKIIDTGYLGSEIFIVVLELPPELQGKNFQAMFDSNRFDCIYQENKIQLYCSGKLNQADQAVFSLLDGEDGQQVFSQTLDLKEIISNDD